VSSEPKNSRSGIEQAFLETGGKNKARVRPPLRRPGITAARSGALVKIGIQGGDLFLATTCDPIENMICIFRVRRAHFKCLTHLEKIYVGLQVQI
jgi:hypothetical protein